MNTVKRLFTSNLKRQLCFISAVFVCSTFGFADQFTLTGVTGGVMGGVYTSPYTAQINNGVSTYAICDDFLHDSYIGQTFTAAVTSVASLNGGTTVKWDQNNASQQQTDYATAAYLAQEIIAEQSKASPNTTLLGEYSFALWNVFDPGLLPASYPTSGSLSDGYGTLTQAQYNGAMAAWNDALANHLSYTAYSNVLIYTPTPNQSISQEFLVVNAVPEASEFSVLGAALIALMCIAWARKRSATATEPI